MITMALTILLFDRHPDEREAVLRALDPGLEVRLETIEPRNFSKRLKAGGYDLALCALESPCGKASQILQEIKGHQRDVPVIWYAAAGEEELDVHALAEAMRQGLNDYVGRLDSPAIPLETAVRQAVEQA